MAEQQDDTEKTEDPTQRRLDDALKKGDVAKSQEVNTWFIIATGTLLLTTFSGNVGSGLFTTFRGLIANSHDIRIDGVALIRLSQTIGLETLAAVAIPFLLLVLAAAAGNMVQHRLVWTYETIQPKLSKISPLAGLKRLFSKQALANFIKGLIKLSVIGGVLASLLWPERDRLEGLVAADPRAILGLATTLALKMLGAVVAILAVVAIADFLFQYRQWFEKQKMSLQEIKEEFRQAEGDPKIKGKLRQIRQSRARKRIIANVPKATVVIANPTHFAVALQYETGMEAPLCVAKGADRLALKIREVAELHSIPIVENPPLARALHASVDIDEEIRPEHYKAVAEVIGYVMRLRRAVARR
jgi:flagellar biosynthetic protein FlhB